MIYLGGGEVVFTISLVNIGVIVIKALIKMVKRMKEAKVKGKIVKIAIKEFSKAMIEILKAVILVGDESKSIFRLQSFLDEVKRITSEYSKDQNRGAS